MNLEQKTYYEKMVSFFATARKRNFASLESNPPHERGLALLNAIFYGTSISSYEDKGGLIAAIYSIIDRSALENNIPEATVKEIKKHHLQELDKVTLSFSILPIKKERREEVVEEILGACDVIRIKENVCHESTTERLAGGLGWLIDLLSNDLPDAYARRALHDGFARMGRPTFNAFGRASTKNIIDPNVMSVIAEMIERAPLLWKNEFFRRVIVDNEFMNQIYAQLALGITCKDAIKFTLLKIKEGNPEFYDYLCNLIDNILSIEESCYGVVEKRKDNMLALFQLEAVHRGLINEEKTLFLFDEPGTRKTITSVVAMVLKMKKCGCENGRILVVCPPHLIQSTWIDELNRRLIPNVFEIRNVHEEVSKGKIVIRKSNKIQIDIVGNSLFSFDKSVKLSSCYDGFIGDEIHNFKKRDGTLDSKRSQAIINYINEANIEHRIGLTGTPIVNDPSEYASLINGFSGKEIINMVHLRAIRSLVGQACYVHLCTSSVVVRRCKEFIMDLPPIEATVVSIPLGEKHLKMFNAEENFLNVWRNESICKIPEANKIINKEKNSKGLVFSYFVSGTSEMDCGIIKKYYDSCPSNRRKIYIAGNGIIDINGNQMDYSIVNADKARRQFEEAKDSVIAYVSVKTCREGINEFKSGDFIIWAMLPFDYAQVNQANSRIHREGRDKERICRIYYLNVTYVRKDNKPYRYQNGKEVKSYDEMCFNRVCKKKELLSAACDGIKKRLDETIDSWNLDGFEEECRTKLTEWMKGKNKEYKFNGQKYITEIMNSIQQMDQNYSELVERRFQEANKVLEEEDVEDIFTCMEKLKTAKDSKAIVVKRAKKIFQNKEIVVAHVGCGKADIPLRNCKKIYKIDKYCIGKDIINCDRSEVANVCPKNSIDFLLATDVMHWDAFKPEKTQNIESTMFAFNEIVKSGAYCLITSPKVYKYPFAINERFLRAKGFKLMVSREFHSIRYCLLKKIGDHKNSKPMSANLLPKRIDNIRFN